MWLSWLGTWSEPVKRFFFVGRDMTESRQVQETLRESEQLARGIIDTALDAFVQIDDQGIILDWNTQAENLLGWRRDEVLGRNAFELMGRPDGQGPPRWRCNPSCVPATMWFASRAANSRSGGGMERRSAPN